MDATQTLTPKQILTKTLAELGWEDPRECTIAEVPREVRRCKSLVFEIELRDSRGCWRKRFPSSGMSPRIGVLVTDSTMRSCMMPPMTTVSWSLATTVV